MDFTGTDGLLMAASTATGAIATQFFNYLRNSRLDEQKHNDDEDDKIIKGYNLTIARLDDRIITLEKAYDTMRREHIDCITVQAELRGEIAALHKQIGNTNNPNSATTLLPSSIPPPVAPPPHRNSPQITPHNHDHPAPPSIPIRSIEPQDQK